MGKTMKIDSRRWRIFLFGVIPIILLYLLSVFFRVGEYKNHRGYNPDNDRHLFRSESSVYYHYTQLMASGDKLPEPDTRIQAPEGLEPKREFTLVMEWMIAKLYSLSGRPGPLHGFIIIFTGVVSSLTIVAAWLMALRLTGSLGAAIFAALCYATSFPAYIRTLGGLLSENFALPLLFLGLALFVRDHKNSCSGIQQFTAAVCLSIAVASWHFSQFVLLLLTAWCWIGFLRKGGDRHTTSSIVLLYMLMVVAGIASPALRAKFFLVSPLMVFLPALAAAYRWHALRWVFFCVAVISVPLTGMLFPEHFSDFSHVYQASWEKLVHAGVKPSDPASVAFETRMFWAGPFDTPLPSRILTGFAIYFVPGLLSIMGWLTVRFRKRDTEHQHYLNDSEGRALNDKALPLFFVFILIPVYLLNARFCVFLSFFVIQAAVIAAAGHRRWLIKIGLVLILMFQGYEVVAFVSPAVKSVRVMTSMILDPPAPLIVERSRKDTVELYDWFLNNAGEDDIVLASPALSADLFQGTEVSTTLHPMFEKREIRELTERFYMCLYGESLSCFERFCKDTEVDYFVYDVNYLLPSSKSSHRYFGGAGKVHQDMPGYCFHFSADRLKAFILVFQNNVFRIYQFIGGSRADAEPLPEVEVYLPIYDPRRFSVSRFDEDAIRFIKGYNFARRLFFTARMQVAAGRTRDALPLLERVEEYFPNDPFLIKLKQNCRRTE